MTTTNLPQKTKNSLELHIVAKKIRDYNGDDLNQLHLSLLAICKLMGVTEAPDDVIITLLIEHIQEHHKDFSKEEIIKAFSLAMAGKLNFEFNHYNRITPQLVSLTLNKYKEQRNKDLVAFQKEADKAKMLESAESTEPSKEELEKLRLDSALTMFDRFKNEKKDPNANVLLPLYDYGNVVYRFLDGIGCINLQAKRSLRYIRLL